MTFEEIRDALLAVNENRCEPPLDQEEVVGIARSVSRYAPEPQPVFGRAGATPPSSSNGAGEPHGHEAGATPPSSSNGTGEPHGHEGGRTDDPADRKDEDRQDAKTGKAGDPEPTPATGAAIILSFFQVKYRPLFRRGNAVVCADGETVPKGVACDVPT